MKLIRIYDKAHRDLKVEAARRGVSLTGAASGMIRHGVKLLKEGKLEIGAGEDDEVELESETEEAAK